MLWSHGGSIYYKPQMFIYINTYKYATILSVRSKSSTVSKFYFWSQRNTHHCHGDMPDLEGGFRGTAFEEDPWAHSWLRLTTLWSVPSVSNWTLKKGGDFRNNLNSDSRELKRRQARVLATQAGEWRVKIQDGRDWGDCPQRASPHNCVHPWSLMGGCASWDRSDLVDRDEGAMRSHEALSSSQPVPALPLPPQSGLSERSSRRDLCREHESHPVSSPLKTLGAFLLYGLTEVSARPCEAPCGLSLRFPALLWVTPAPSLFGSARCSLPLLFQPLVQKSSQCPA